MGTHTFPRRDLDATFIDHCAVLGRILKSLLNAAPIAAGGAVSVPSGHYKAPPTAAANSPLLAVIAAVTPSSRYLLVIASLVALAHRISNAPN